MKIVNRSLAMQILLGIFLGIVIPFIMIIGMVKGKYETYLTNELQDRIEQTLLKGVEDVYDYVYDTLNFSNGIVYADELNLAFESDISYYEKYKVFNNVLSQLYYMGVYDDESIKVTIVEETGNIYSNWERGFEDYSFLNDKPLVLNSRNSRNSKEDIKLEFFQDGSIYNDDERYVNIVRNMLHNKTGEISATLIVSIRQSKISEILSKYLYSKNDRVYLCDNEGSIILKNNNENSELYDENSINEVIKSIPEDKIVSIKNDKYIVSNYIIEEQLGVIGDKFSVYYFTGYNGVMDAFNDFSKAISVIILITILVISICLVILIIWIVRPIKVLSNSLNEYNMNINEKELKLNIKRSDEIGKLNNSFYKMHNNINELFNQVQKEQKFKEEYKLNYLKAQLNPHFLFNTLGAIKWMAIAKNTDGIVEIINSLGNMLKYSMGKESDIVTVKEEIENIEGYLKIQNIRYGHICTIKIENSEEFNEYKIIRFILQPVVENAIIHGFKERKSDNMIEIIFNDTEENLIIKIKNNGDVIEEDKLEKLQSRLQHSTIDEEYIDKIGNKKFNNIGILNVDNQIKMKYGKEYGISINNEDEDFTVVTYILPKIGRTNDEESYHS